MAREIFELSRKFLREELYSLTDQIRRASRSVCSNITEAWRKRRYEAALVSKLNDAETEAAETQTWLRFSLDCRYISKEEFTSIYEIYNLILGKLVTMINHPEPWLLNHHKEEKKRKSAP